MKNLKELEKKYEELGKEIENLKKEQEQENDILKDPIFLLSVEEYKKYKCKIPQINCWWWLRSSGVYSNRAAFVNIDGSVSYYGNFAHFNDGALRPALKFANLTGLHRHIKSIDDKTIIFCGVTWTQIDDGLYIAEMPISFRLFNEKYKKSDDYTTTEVRKFLLNWYEERKDW